MPWMKLGSRSSRKASAYTMLLTPSVVVKIWTSFTSPVCIEKQFRMVTDPVNVEFLTR
ncbi:hypothetical protein AALD22_03545 [Lachnospiraceae bacterium 56-18]